MTVVHLCWNGVVKRGTGGIICFTAVKEFSFKKQSNKWIAQCSVDGKKVHIGVFDTEQEARDARKTAIKAIPYIL